MHECVCVCVCVCVCQYVVQNVYYLGVVTVEKGLSLVVCRQSLLIK